MRARARQVCSFWPIERGGEALDALVEHSFGAGVETKRVRAATLELPAALVAELTTSRTVPTGLTAWFDATGAQLGVELDAVDVASDEIEGVLRRLPPALFLVEENGAPAFAVLLGRTRGSVRVLTPELEERTVSPRVIAQAMCTPASRSAAAREAGALLDAAEISAERRSRATAALVDAISPEASRGTAWIVRPVPARRGRRGLFGLARAERLHGPLLAFGLAQITRGLLWVASWWLLGKGALEGRLEVGWLSAWALMLIGLIPLGLLATAAAGTFSIRGGALVERLLLYGAMRLDPGEVRRQGTGRLLGAVLEARVLEEALLAGGMLAIAAVIDLALALWVLGYAAGSSIEVVLLCGWLVLSVLVAVRVFRRRRAWTEKRVELTGDLIEAMVGHRTRLAQEPASLRNAGSDRDLERYQQQSRRYDGASILLYGLLPRGWLIVGTLGFAPILLRGAESETLLAVTVGGVLLAANAFRQLADGIDRLVAAACAWGPVRQFIDAGARREIDGEPRTVAASYESTSASSSMSRWGAPSSHSGAAVVAHGSPGSTDVGTGDRRRRRRSSWSRANGSRRRDLPLLEALDIEYRHPGRDRATLAGSSLEIHSGDRVLIEGPSGGGKSTLASVLSSSRAPSAGSLFLDGLDRETIGENAWRRSVALAPQYHDNHVFMGPLHFNLLLGRPWPPSQQDLDEATKVCRGLGLGGLIERMPGGITQLVGETGWQLSHGERSRVYIARALLQNARVLVLDESFAALDPKTLQQSLNYVLEHSPTLVVIAHP